LRSFSGRCRRTVSRHRPACSVNVIIAPTCNSSVQRRSALRWFEQAVATRSPSTSSEGLRSASVGSSPKAASRLSRRNGAWSGTPSSRRRRCPHRPRPRPPPAGLSSRPQCLAPISSACVLTGSSLLGDVVTSVGRRGKLIPWRLEELAPPEGGELMALASPEEYHLRLLVCGERACCRR
jgi:hypothetical protein